MPTTLFVEATALHTRAMVRDESKTLLSRAVECLSIWMERSSQRATLRDLADESPHLLRDIGVSRSQALEESRKSFWRL